LQPNKVENQSSDNLFGAKLQGLFSKLFNFPVLSLPGSL
jgi:hypothetical protein